MCSQVKIYAKKTRIYFDRANVLIVLSSDSKGLLN